MTSKSLKTTTAILAALSLLQPLPALTQSSPVGNDGAIAGQVPQLVAGDSRSFEEICAEAMILDALACDLHIQKLLAAAGSVSAPRASWAQQAPCPTPP